MMGGVLDWIGTLDVGPNDVVILRARHRLTAAMADHLRAELDERLGGKRVVILSPELGLTSLSEAVVVSALKRALAAATAGDAPSILPDERRALQRLIELVEPEDHERPF